jgi:hypothetical protein
LSPEPEDEVSFSSGVKGLGVVITTFGVGELSAANAIAGEESASIHYNNQLLILVINKVPTPNEFQSFTSSAPLRLICKIDTPSFTTL